MLMHKNELFINTNVLSFFFFFWMGEGRGLIKVSGLGIYFGVVFVKYAFI